MATPKLQYFRADRATYVAGDVASISVSFDQVVNVDTFGGFRVPVLVLSNGARAYYSGGSGTDELRFQYNVSETDRSSLDLKVVAFAENDATIRNVAGEDADVTVRFNDVGSLSANNDILTPNELRGGEDGEFVTVQTQSLSTGADLVNPKIASMSSVSGTYGVGTTLDIVVSFDEVVLVRTAGGVPTLKFAGSGDVLEGFAASYVGGSGTKKLTFRVEIADGMPTASGLDVIDLSLNGGVITDLSGNSANLSIVAGTNNLAPYADIQVDGSSGDGGGVTQPGGDGSSDVTAAVIESIQSIKGDGPFDVGDRVDLRVTLSEAVTLNTLLGSPILALSNGGTAQYVSGSGTRDLLFRYTVKASDRNTQDLNVIGVAENDALIVDAAGNRTDVRITADNQLAKFGNVVIDAQAPYLRSVDAADDTYIVGDSITFTGTFSEAVTVTGTPGLNLSNGGVARYVSGSGSSLLVFKYDVTGSSQSSADLDVLSLNVADGAFASAVTGNAATVQVAPGILSFDADVLIDTSRPSGTISIDKTSLIANEVASVTVTFDEQVEDPRSAITVLNGTLSDLVGGAGDETGARSRVWTGTFTPALGIEDPTNALVLDNSKVFDDAGNPGIGLAASANFLIDTRGPVPVVSSVAQADGSRLLTVDFGEAVTDLSASGLVVENGVAGTFSKLSDSKYTLSVTPEASNPSGSIRLSLADNVIQDALGNYNDPFSASFVWDETSPVIEQITSVAASYTTGQDIYIDVEFNEPVTVSPIHADAGSNPILALSNGQVAHYASGSGTTSLTFRYTVQRGDEASDLDSLALVENASRIHDISGNDAQVKITPGLNNLAFATNIVIDGVVPSITNVSADDGLYQAGDEVRLDVQFSEDVTLDRSGGDPILALSNGSYASFVSHDGDRMVFSYAVSTGDNDAQDLDVLGFAENGSAIADASGNRANVAIRFGMNNLAERNEVNIDAARPQIAETSANAGEYKAGQQIEIALAMSKGVVVDTTQGDPSLELNNGREAIFDAEKSTATTLWFVYDVLATDVREDTDTGTLYEEYDLSIKEFKYNNAEIRSLIGGADAQMTLPLSGLASEAVRIDLTLPEVVSISLSDTSLSAGEDADVTVVLSEPVRQLDVSYFSVPHGSLSAFTTTDNITWHAVYTPVRDVEADELVISLDASRLSDEAGNLGLGEAQSGSYSLDSTYPDLEIRSDASGVVHKGQEVRFTLQFSEAVTNFTDADVKVINGEKVPFSFDGPNAEGEYSIMVRPHEGSRQPIKVYVEAGAAADGAGNLSRASLVFVQPVDTDPPKIEQIAGVKGSYALGDTISIDVTFTEAVTLQLEPDLSQHVLPHLALNNGQEARYVAGSGGKTWTFEYVVSTPEDVTQLVDRETLKVLALVENDTSLLDAAGNKLEDYFVEASNQLNAGLSVDTTGAVITGFSSVDGTYKTDDVLYIRAHLSELVHVQGTPAPYLMLSNGGRATYLSGSGSSQLMFRYIVDEADGNASDLSVVSFNAPDAGILDRAGNVTDLGIVSGDNDLAAAHQIVVDTQAPELTGVRLVEDAGTASDVVNDGYYKAGTVLAFEVDFDDAVSVDVSGGTPILTLSNGSIAQYVGYVQVNDSGTMVDDPTKLRFEYTVLQDDINTRELKVTGLAERGAKITDQAGNEAYVEVNDDQLNYTKAVVDTIAPTQDGSSDSFTANERGDDLVRTPQTITVTLRSKEVIGFDYSSIDYDVLNAQTRGDLGLEADASQEDLDAAVVQSIYAAEQAVALSGINVTFAGSRADGNGFALTDLDGDLVATNYRLVANEQGVVDGMAFAVDVDVPDRAMGTLTVSVTPGALEDLALNANADVFSHDQAVDTQTVDFAVTPAAGLFIGATSEVKIYDSVGDELSAGYRLDPATGQVVISVEPSTKYPNGYRGPVLVEVIDSDASPEYIDEFTGQAVSLSDGSESYSMRAVLNVTSPGEVPVTVSPVTELSVKKLFEAATPSATTPLDPAKVEQFNSGIAKIFGLSEIVHTKATVINSALVEQTTGVDVDDFDLTDGVSASEQYGQVLAMLSARDSQSGSLAATVDELAATIKAISQAGQTTLAITQLGADKLAAALDSSALDDDLDGAGINRELLDVAYIDEASAAGYGLNLDEAEATEVPVKGAQVGDTVFVQWGVIARPDTNAGDVLGAPNRFSVVIDASHLQADGSVRVPVPLSVIEKQGDANEVAVSTAVLPAGSVDSDGNPVTAPAENDYRAPVLLTVDIIPPQTNVQAPDPSTPFVTLGDVEGIRGGDDLTVLLNNSADEHFKYVLSTQFLNDYAEAISGGATASSALELIADQIPTGLTVSNVVQDAASGTWAFDWSLNLTQAISVAEQTAEAEAIAAGESYTPSATFAVDDERSVFQVQASTADLVGNADADDARNEVIIGSVDDLVDTPEEQSAMDQALNRLSARYGDAAVDTRAEIKTLADAIDGVTTLKNSGDPAATSGDLVAAAQVLVLGSGSAAGTPGAVDAGVHTLSIGAQTFSVDLSNSLSPTVADVIDEIASSDGYADLPYKVGLDATGNGLAISWKAFGPQPAASSDVAVTSTKPATTLNSTISNPGSLASFAVQAITVDGETVEGGFVPAAGDVTVTFGGTALSVTVSEGDSLADILAGLKGDGGYAGLPFRLTVNQAGDGLVATWKATQPTPVTDHITLDRNFEVTTMREFYADPVATGSAGVTTHELAALDITNVDDSELAAINRALASDLAAVSAPAVSFADSALAAGESTTVSLTFGKRVGQVPDDVMALVGGELSSAGAAGDPIWSTADGLTWTATFTASGDIPNTELRYAERLDADGVAVVDGNGNAVLDPVVVDGSTNPVTYGRAGDDLSQIALTEALVNRVTDAAARVAAFAGRQGDIPAASPSVQDFADMAVSGVRADNLSALQDALGAMRDRFEGRGDLYTQIQTVADSYNTVFGTVYTPGATTQPSSAELVQDLTNLGVSNLSADSARAEDQMTLLQGALRAVAATKADITNEGTVTTAAEQQADMVDTVEKLESFVASVERVLARANGEQVVDGSGTPIVDDNGNPVRVEVSDSDLMALGFGALLVDPSSNSRLSSLQKVIVDQSKGAGSAGIVAYADLKVVLETAVNAFDDIVAVTAAARDTTGSVDEQATALATALAAVDADTFQEMGIDGVKDPAIGSLTAAAMADVVKDALSNTGNAINSLESIQQVVDSYRQVLSVASGEATGDQAVISAGQLSDLGVTLLERDAQEPSALAELLSGIIAKKAAPASGTATDNVDSISELQALANAATKVFDSAALNTDPANASVLANLNDLNTLGFNAVNADNLDAIQRVLVRNAADRDAVKDYSGLKSLIDAAVDAHTALTSVVTTAQGGSTPDLTGLDETDFAAMGLDDVDNSNVAAVLDALSNTPNSIATAAQLQAVVDSTNVILDTASNDTGTIDKNDLTNIGITLGSGALTDNDASLASGVIASLTSDKVDTVSEVQAIVNAIDAVFANAAPTSDDDTVNTVTVTKEQLLTLGFDGSGEALEVTDHNLDAIQRVLTDQANEDAVASYGDLRTKINDAITAHTDILNAATANDVTDIDETDYAAMGIDGVDTNNLSSINDALINTGNVLTTAASVQKVVDSYNHILDLRAGDANGGDSNIALDADDFTDLGVTLKAAGAEQTQQLAYLQEIVKDGVGNGSLATVADLQDFADATSDLIDMVQQVSSDSDGVTGLTPEQFALLGIDDGATPAGAITAAQADMLSKRLALVADLSDDVTDLATDLKGLWDDAMVSLAKIKAYAEGDGVSDFDGDTSFSPADTDDVPTVDDFKNIGVTDYVVPESVAHALTISGGSLIVDGNEASNFPSAITTTSGKSVNLVEAVVSDGERYYYLNVDNTGGFSYDDDRLNWTEIDEVFAAAAAQGAQLVLPEEGLGNIDVVLNDLEAVSGLATGGDQWNWYATATDRRSSTSFGGDSGADTPSVVLVKVQSTPLPAPDTRVGGTYEYDLSDASLDGELISITADGTELTNGVTIEGTPGAAGSKLVFTPTSDLDPNQTFKLVASSGLEIPMDVQGAVPIDMSNIASINELFAAISVGLDSGDLPATTAAEDQAVIDQGATRLQAIVKIANYAATNGADPAPDAADFAAAGVSGVADSNNIPAILAKLRSQAVSYSAADTAGELQAFVKNVAIEKIANWADSDGGNGAAPILQDYLNAGLVGPFEAPATTGDAITTAIVPVLNELFANVAVATDAADTFALQQGVINGAKAQIEAIAKIASYAEADGSIDFSDPADGVDDHLTVADFKAAGISGVADGTNLLTGTGTLVPASGYNNLSAVLAKLADSGIEFINADTVYEVQQLVADVAVEKINAYADANGVLPLVSETISVFVSAKSGGGGDAFYLDGAEAPALELKAGTYTFDQSDISNSGHPLSFFSAAESGLLPAGITATQTGTLGTAGAQTVVVVDETFSGKVYYACPNHAGMGNSAEVEPPYFAPQLQDYNNAGLEDPADSAIVAGQVEAINTLFAAADTGGVSGTDTYHADDFANQQAIIDAGSAKLAAIHKIATYARDSSGSALGVPTAADYDAAGVVGVFDANNNGNGLSNIVSVNAALISDAGSYDAANSPVEIQKVASRARITDYANVNGLAADGVTALHDDVVPTIADYANVGVTEVYDGTQMVAIDAGNLDQVNDVMAMRYVGNPANGSVDVLTNNTNTKETNLNYAGTVDTVAEIQTAVSRALGDAADADSSTFGDRAVALNKIAAFAQAVSGLVGQAAYDAYIEDAANANSIPTYQDYNAAGVLDLTDSTDGITSALATAINAKLFTGGATSAVNTVAELQPYVDSANVIVDKIAAWAEPDWSGVGTSESYISLVPKFANANFEDGSGDNIPGWVAYNDWVDLGVTQLAGFTSPQDPVAGPTHSSGGLAQEVTQDWTTKITNRSISVTLQENYDAQHGSVVVLDTGELGGTAGNQWGTGTANNIFHGPAIWSEGTVKLKSGAKVSIDFQAIRAGDAADVYGYLLNVDNGQHIDLLDFNPYVDGVDESWQTASVTLTDGQDGEYRFVFVGGSNNGDNGSFGGGKFIIDNILVDTPPEKFNGVISSNDDSDYVNTQAVFDGKGYVDGTTLAFRSATPASASPGSQVELGWYDQGDFGFDPAVAEKLIIHPKNTGTDFTKLPTDFDVMGWDNAAGQWELIKTFAPSEKLNATVSTIGSGSAYEVQTIASPAINNSGYYTLKIGDDRVVVQLDADASISELATALDNALTSASVSVTVANSGNNLTLTWDTQKIVEAGDRAELTIQSVVETTDGKALEFDLSDSTRAYTGFKVVARDTLGGDGTVEITELDFKARKVNVADLVAANSEAQPTFQDYNAIGFAQVTASNVADINALVFAKSARSELSTLPQIGAIIQTYVSALDKIKAFADGDGASDTNLNFISDGTETGVPTVGDYQAIGLRYVKNSNGLNVPISNENIAAINEVIAQAAYGADIVDTPVTDTASLRAIFGTDANVNRLTAISKISELAEVSPTSITLSDQVTPTVSTGDVVILKLTTSFGSETISGTYGTEATWAGLASTLSADLGANSGFVITQKAGSGSGITITRADGYEFKVEAVASATEVASNFVLSDDASATTVTATETAAGNDIQKIALLQSDLVNGAPYEFTIGSDIYTVYAPSTGTPALSDLVTALNNAISGSEPTVSIDGTSGLTITWTDNSSNVVPTLKMSDTVGIISGQTITDSSPRDGDGTTAEEHALAFAVANNTVYELNIGDDKYVVATDDAATLSELAVDLNTAISGTEPVVSVNTAAGATGLYVTWVDTKTNITEPVSLRVAGSAQSAQLTVDGNANELTVADFTAAGVSGITSGNIEESVQTLVAKTAKSQIDTSLEITSSLNPPSQTITIDEISTDSGVDTDFITNDGDGLTVTATLTAALGAGQSLMYSNDNGANFIDITSSVSGTAVIYVDSGLTSSDTIQMKIVDVAGGSTAVETRAVVIDTTPPAVPSAVTVNSATITVVGESGGTVGIFEGATDITDKFTQSETGGTYTLTPISDEFDGSTLSLTAKIADVAFNISDASTAFSVDFDTSAPSAPTLALSGRTVTVTGEAGGSAKIYDGGTDITHKFTVSETSGTYTAVANTSAFSGSESLVLTAKVVDASGNMSAASSSVSGSIDTTAPSFVSQSGTYFDTAGTENYLDAPRITQLGNGEYVVGWRAYTSSSDISLYTQRLDTNGVATGTAIKHNAVTVTNYALHEGNMSIVSVDDDGTYAVVWDHYNSSSTNDSRVANQKEITVQVVKPDDTLETATLLATTVSSDKKNFPSVIEYATGKFVVAYASGAEDTSGDFYPNVKAAFFTKTGQIDTNVTASGYLDLDLVSNTNIDWDFGPLMVKQPSSGDIIFAWPEYDGVDYNIAVTVYDVSAGSFSTKVLLDYGTGDKDGSPQIITKSDGEFTVVWESTDGTTTTIVGQKFTASGAISGTQTTIDGSDPQVQDFADTSTLGAVAYKDGSDIKVQALIASSGFSTAVTLTNADTNNSYQLVEMAAGKFAVVYGYPIGFGDTRVAVQKFNADGTADGSAITLPAGSGHSSTTLDPQVSYDAGDGSLLVLWDDGKNYSSSSTGTKTDGIWLHKVLSDGTVETTSSSFGFGAVLDYTEAGSNQTLSVLTSGVEDSQTVTLTLNGQTYTGAISSDAASIAVPTADLKDLASGTVTYTIDVDDAAGNSATQFSGSFVKNGISFAGIDVDSDTTLDFTDPSATAGTDGSGDGTIDAVLDVSDAVAGDVYELYIDGTLINTDGTSITQTNINNGTVTVAGVDIAGNDSDTAGTGVNTNADEVLIEIKLKSGGSYITDGTDTQWDYQY